MARNSPTTDIDIVRWQWTDQMVRRRIDLDRLFVDENPTAWLSIERINDLEGILRERGLMLGDRDLTMLDKMLDAISIFRDGEHD